MRWSQAHGSARAVVSEAKIKFISLSLLVDSDLSDSELPASHNFWADRKNFVGAYPPVARSFHILCPLLDLVPSSKFQHTVHYNTYRMVSLMIKLQQ